MNLENKHPEWCPLDHGQPSPDASFPRVLTIILEGDEMFEIPPLEIMTIRDRTDSYIDRVCITMSASTMT